MTDTRTLYRSDSRPVFEPFTLQAPPVKGFQYEGDLAYELRSHSMIGSTAIDLLDDMLAIRELEMRSLMPSTELAPTAVPSWPIDTCVGPR